VVGFAGVVGADWIIYTAGRRYGATIVSHPWLARLFGAARMAAVRHAVERHGVRAVFLARFMFGFRIATFLAAGTFGVPAPRFAVAEAAGAAIFVPAMATLGFLFSDRAERVARNVSVVEHWTLLAGLVGLSLYLALRALAARSGRDGGRAAGAADALPDAEYGAGAVERRSRVGEGVPAEHRHAGRERRHRQSLHHGRAARVRRGGPEHSGPHRRHLGPRARQD